MSVKISGKLLVILFSWMPVSLAAQSLEPRDYVEIRKQVEQTLQGFALLLNQIADPTFFPSEIEEIIRNSYRPDNPGRVFYDASVIIENDLTPVGTVAENTGLNDKKAADYLPYFDLLYSKHEEATVVFSNLQFGPVRENEYLFISVSYNSILKGWLKDEPDKRLPRHKRVATIRVEKADGGWRAYIQQVNFFSPDFEFILNYQDADGDGIVDSEDECPGEVGSKQWKGCPPPPNPDYDQDGVIDIEDRCPGQKGPWCAQGCPVKTRKKGGESKVAWHELLGNTGLDIAYDVTKNERGEIIFAGETEIPGKGKELYMAIFDPCRKYIRNRLVMGGAQDDGARKVIQVGPGQYAVAGYTESSGSGSPDAWLLLTDGTRKTGEKFFGTSRSSESFADISKTAQGNLVFTGEKDRKIWLVVTSPAGELLQEAVYGKSKQATGAALALSPGGEIYVTGYEMSGGREKLLVLHYNEASGRLEKIYERNNARGLDIIVDQEGQLVVTGTAYTKRTRDDIFVVRLDPAGNLLWKEAKTFGGIGIDVGCAILETEAGNYVLAGYSSSYAGGARREKLWAHFLSPAGELLWEEPLFWGGRFSERAYGITQIEANSVIVVGLSRSSVPLKKARKSDFCLVSISLK